MRTLRRYRRFVACPVRLQRGKSTRSQYLHEGVIPIPDDRGTGVGIRVDRGPSMSGGAGVSGEWIEGAVEFEVLEDQRSIEFVLELRARHGRVWVRPKLAQAPST